MSRPDDHGADKERLKCPHCASHLATRTSRSVTPTFKQKVLQCSNAECGASFGYAAEITHQISPSACPNPDVQIRTSSPRAKRAPANDDSPARTSGPEVPLPANDEDAAGIATG